ncbi:indolepyruvate oxidoreductase subunit beta family protein [Bradyrhizobium sp. U87765 SZCCT0131]|uniref:indolepyruvate oxidoreductase subunit beta family protein n=1 Tax=unclassified Bradyrhizobium TaxID=2631580 RepID=UPI001BA46C02|nr:MULTISPECIES: indolepyruvate oxidoreductase subunit beta family protein [unclassified Bradyrhizobium]MBR1219202.1 indolepyruvate oxidoreductase subunit beta family protein [Bradyrhizobium sp. U87765 SZCCT0131]MBR1261853.1 indolepyruvate oxidoreductase subunit beta family protein [Bradyrhizobium sp. U87765 SZCCT0134]MBR1306294.1 indolepyruvate oxidoreductase subunit beta family protein [Bradyrhizobium sp. U87765 SZCCT0110]MBR1317635.1 indolepyruvate oxidoreductase subunit beta family protein 
MNQHVTNAARLATVKPLSIAILAMGGQGGGVLADWIVALAEAQGFVAQSTSVPGVAQRTGATIYYVEMLPAKDGIAPILSLMPTPGDVDVVLAAELMEAGRSVLRGLVTPDRTLLIASTHRAFAVSEKEAPGDGAGNPVVVVDATDIAARKTIAFDMEALAQRNGSVISSVLFGALAASGALPFDRSAFEATIRGGGKGADASLKAFAAAYDRARDKPRDVVALPAKRLDPLPVRAGHPLLDALIDRIRTGFPDAAHAMLFAGVKRLVDFQDVAYADEYLDRMMDLLACDRAGGGEAHGFAFTTHAAKYLAVAMAYDDVIRVADLKVRATRFARVRAEVGAKDDQIVATTEYMHPRMEEVCGTLPKGLGEWIEARPKLFAALDRLVNKGRRVRTNTIFWFVALYAVSALRARRRGTLRHHREGLHREAWLDRAVALLATNYDLAVEVLDCRRLVKGYSDTHARGQSKFDRVLSALPQLAGRADGAAWLKRLRQAALMDEGGVALDGALKTIATL